MDLAYGLHYVYDHGSQGEYKTVFYAIGTGIMALGMMIPAMGSGWIQETLGYKNSLSGF